MTVRAPVRSGILELMRRELIGPDPRPEHDAFNGGEEILRPQDPPRLRYSAGVLFPGGAKVEASDVATSEEAEAGDSGPPDGDEPDDVTPTGTSGDSDSGTDHEVNRANEFLPSAVGLTAVVRLPRRLRIAVRGGRYDRR